MTEATNPLEARQVTKLKTEIIKGGGKCQQTKKEAGDHRAGGVALELSLDGFSDRGPAAE